MSAMLTEVRGDNSRNATATPERPAWWARLVARLPLATLYGLASFFGWLTFRFFPYREHVVRENLSKAFPAFDEPQLREVMRRYYLGFAQLRLVEGGKSLREVLVHDVLTVRKETKREPAENAREPVQCR